MSEIVLSDVRPDDLFPHSVRMPVPAPNRPPPIPAATTATTGPPSFRLWVVSDLRVDRSGWTPPRGLHVDAVVVAGNVGPGLSRGLRWLAAAFDPCRADKPLVFVPGAVDLSDGTPVAEALAAATPLARDLGIALLHDAALRLSGPGDHGLHLIGGTLWPDFRGDGADEPRLARRQARARWEVLKHVAAAPDTPFAPHDVAGAHARSLAFVEDALLCVSHGGSVSRRDTPVVAGVRGGDRAVVVSAFPPTRSCLPTALRTPLLDPVATSWQSSNCDRLFDAHIAPDAWIFGGAAHPVDMRAGRTRLVANPRNDATDPRSGFDPTRVVTV